MLTTPSPHQAHLMKCYSPHTAPAIHCHIVCQAKGKGASKERKRAPAPQQDAAGSTESQTVVSALAGPALRPAGELDQAVSQNHGSHPSKDRFPGRGQVWQSCAVTCGGIAALGLGVRQYAATLAPSVAHTDPEAVAGLLQLQPQLFREHAGLVLAVSAGVTVARVTLQRAWRPFQEASQAANDQVLTRLQPLDLIWVAGLPAVSEELLFRGGLIPAVLPDWRGVIISAAIFGALHQDAKRNWQFAVWAAAVGLVYGTAFVATHDLLVPIGAHWLSNLASGGFWFLRRASHARKS